MARTFEFVLKFVRCGTVTDSVSKPDYLLLFNSAPNEWVGLKSWYVSATERRGLKK